MTARTRPRRAPGYDLLLRGGEVIDPSGPSGRLDVAVRDGRIAAVEPRIDPADAAEVADVTGGLVTPGLVDLHTHVFTGATYWGIDPDQLAWATGVTTWVDAGSAGAYALPAFAEQIARTEVAVPVLLNVSTLGLTGETGESLQLVNCDVDRAVEAIRRHPGLVRGVKVRMDRNTVGDNGIEPVRRGLEIAETCGLPVMVHISYPPPSLSEYVSLLRPGDVVTHCCSATAAAGRADGGAGPEVRAAYEKGLILDLGHGSGGFSFDVLDAQLAAGLRPHTISTDLHARSVYGPAFDLPTTMTTMLAAGFDVAEVVAATTVGPAAVLGLDAGTLTVGAVADLAVFDLVEEPTVVSDAHAHLRTAPARLVNRATYRRGRPLRPRLPDPPAPWIPLAPAQHAALAEREAAIRALITTNLVAPDQLPEQFDPHGLGRTPDRSEAAAVPDPRPEDTRPDETRPEEMR